MAAGEIQTSSGTNLTEVKTRPARVSSIDAYRGMVMFLMLAETMSLHSLVESYPESTFFQWLHFHTSHVEWTGCSLHDLIQPSFSFLVGVAMPFSIASRLARGGSQSAIFLHALWRSFALIALGIFLRSLGKPQTNFTFEDTLTQIGLGYFPLFLIGTKSWRVVWASLLAILIGYWALFALYPLPAVDFDRTAVGVPLDWPHWFDGFLAHWNKNTNPAWAFDLWWLNLFPRTKEFIFNGGGYVTLSSVPTLATMILGLVAGKWLKEIEQAPIKIRNLLIASALCLLSGFALEYFGICPIVKRIWTPAWVLWSGGWCFLFLAGFFAIADWWGKRDLFFPLMVIGANSIAIYVMSWTIESWVKENLTRHFGNQPFAILGPVWEPVLLGAATMLILWLVLLWMYRKRIFVKI